MHRQKRALYKGIGLLLSFSVVLVLLFLPIIDGRNPMEYMDNLFNSISKGSAYYIPKVKETVQGYQGNPLALTLTMADEKQAGRLSGLLGGREVAVAVSGNQVAISGSLNTLLLQALEDADIMYVNDAERIVAKYGYNERQALFDWWSTLKALEYELNRQKRFDAAKLVALVQAKAVETSYNYYGIKAENIGDKIGIVLIALAFYVIYTLWYGFGIMYLFEGWGMNLGH
ncbi:MAG: hypothetical protein R6W95_15045 [Desulfosarcina sp.]